jgi:hypothetical protein
LHSFAHPGARLAEDAQQFASRNNLFKFFFIMYLTGTSEVANLAVTPLLPESRAPGDKICGKEKQENPNENISPLLAARPLAALYWVGFRGWHSGP